MNQNIILILHQPKFFGLSFHFLFVEKEFSFGVIIYLLVRIETALKLMLVFADPNCFEVLTDKKRITSSNKWSHLVQYFSFSMICTFCFFLWDSFNVIPLRNIAAFLCFLLTGVGLLQLILKLNHKVRMDREDSFTFCQVGLN